MLKKTKIIIGISSAVGIAAIATTAIVTPLTQISNQNLKVSDDQFSMEKVSDIWNNTNEKTNYVDQEFEKILNFDIEKVNKKDNIYSAVAYSSGNENKANQIMLELSKQLKVLNQNQKNKIKNQMLKMFEITSKTNLNPNNITEILKSFTTKENIKKVEEEIRKIDTNAKDKIKEKTSFFSLKNQDKIVKYSYYSDNQKTTAGQVINKLNVATSTLAGISAGAAVAAAISYGIAWLTFGASIPWAVGATVLSAVTGALSAATGIASLAIQREANQTPSGWSVAITTISGAYSLTSVIKTLVTTATSVSVAVGTFSWVFPPVIAAVAVVVFILSVFQTING